MGATKLFNRTLSEKETNPKFYAPIECAECQSRSKLQRHEYNDWILCDGCVQELNWKLREAEEEKEDYYSEQSYNSICAERNR